MSEFKVGDRVVCVDDGDGRSPHVKSGREYMVRDVAPEYLYLEGVNGGMSRSRFRPAPPAPEAEEPPRVGETWETENSHWNPAIVVKDHGDGDYVCSHATDPEFRGGLFRFGAHGTASMRLLRRLSKAETGHAQPVAEQGEAVKAKPPCVACGQPATTGERCVYCAHRRDLSLGSREVVPPHGHVATLEQRIAAAKDQHLRDLDRGRAERERNVRHWPEAFSTPGWEEP